MSKRTSAKKSVSKRGPVKRSVAKRGSAKEKSLSGAELEAALREHLAKALGTTNPDVQDRLINHALNTLWRPAGLSKAEVMIQAASLASMLKEIKPQDGLEGMLAVQMLGAHNAAMECLRRAMLKEQSFEGREQNLKHSAKFMSLFNQQLGALNKHRGKGQQKITIEHVNVAPGAQAIVGHIEASAAGSKEEIKNEAPRSLAYDPGETLDLPVKRDEAVKLVTRGEAQTIKGRQRNAFKSSS